MTIKERLTATVERVWPRLFEPVDIASIVFFRIAFGVLLLVEVWRYFQLGWIKRFYIDPPFHFTYYGFGWVKPLPGSGMYVVFVALGIFSLCVVLGFKYRAAAAGMFLTFSYVFLLDQARYLNHFYLIVLISFLFIFIPAHRSLSLDARLQPSLRSPNVPRWTLWILRAQFTILYVYGGIAKIGGDWLRGSPMRGMLAQNSDFPWIGRYFSDERVVMAFAYGGLLFDLFIVPLLLWKRTRWLALAWAAAFHGMNHHLFHIGIFPFFGMAGTLLFLPPDWPRRLIPKRFAGPVPETPAPQKGRTRKLVLPAYSHPAAMLLYAFFILQILLPVRHFLYPGNVNWTDEGQRFAWRMMLRAKQATGRFVAIDRFTGQQRAIYPAQYLDREQVAVMWIQPDMILQYAHHIAGQLRREGWQVIEVRADVQARLNGRRAQRLVDPQVNLAAQKRNLLPAKWIVPLTEPLPEPGKRVH